MKVILVDDNLTFREALTFTLQQRLDIEIIGQASTGKELLALKNLHQANLILIDIEMPEMGGVEAAKNILWKFPYLNLIAITMYRDKAYLKQLIEAGIRGCVFKTELDQYIDEAIKTVMSGKVYFPHDIEIGDS